MIDASRVEIVGLQPSSLVGLIKHDFTSCTPCSGGSNYHNIQTIKTSHNWEQQVTDQHMLFMDESSVAVECFRLFISFFKIVLITVILGCKCKSHLCNR